MSVKNRKTYFFQKNQNANKNGKRQCNKCSRSECRSAIEEQLPESHPISFLAMYSANYAIDQKRNRDSNLLPSKS